MLSAEEFIKQHSMWQRGNSSNGNGVSRYNLKTYKSKNEIASEIGISRQTVSKRIWELGIYEIEVWGRGYYVMDKDIIKFAFYILNNK